jgi:hypothetical protein
LDCPACQSFHSILDEDCSDCGFPLPPPPRAGALYRRAATIPARGVRARVKYWARVALGRGRPAHELASVLVRRGYEESWSRDLVSRLEPLKRRRIGFVAFWVDRARELGRTLIAPGTRRGWVLVAAGALFLSHGNGNEHANAGNGGDTSVERNCDHDLALGRVTTCP